MEETTTTPVKQQVIITLSETEDSAGKVDISMVFEPEIKDESLQALTAGVSAPIKVSATLLQFFQILGSSSGGQFLHTLREYHDAIMREAPESEKEDACKEEGCCGGECHKSSDSTVQDDLDLGDTKLGPACDISDPGCESCQ